MTTIDITCSLPAPTLTQVRAWLTREGWEVDPSHRGLRSTVWWHVSALHPRGGREGLRLTEGGIDATIVHASHVLTRIRGTECTPEAVYREIMGQSRVWVAHFPSPSGTAFDVFATRHAADHAASFCDGATVEEREVRP